MYIKAELQVQSNYKIDVLPMDVYSALINHYITINNTSLAIQK